MSEAVLSPCQMTELTHTVWAAAGSGWVNISWGPEWIGQHTEFRTKLLTHCLNSRLTSQSRDKMIIYYSHTIQAVNLSPATDLIEILFTSRPKVQYIVQFLSGEKITSQLSYHTMVFVHNRCIYFTFRSCAGEEENNVSHILTGALCVSVCALFTCGCTHVSMHVQCCVMYCISQQHHPWSC